MEVAESLARHRSRPDLLGFLLGFFDRSEQTRHVWASPRAELSLDGLVTITAGVARALARHGGSLSLDGLTDLSDEAAEALARHKSGMLSLCGLVSMSERARVLLQANQSIVLLYR